MGTLTHGTASSPCIVHLSVFLRLWGSIWKAGPSHLKLSEIFSIKLFEVLLSSELSRSPMADLRDQWLCLCPGLPGWLGMVFKYFSYPEEYLWAIADKHCFHYFFHSEKYLTKAYWGRKDFQYGMVLLHVLLLLVNEYSCFGQCLSRVKTRQEIWTEIESRRSQTDTM